MAKQKRLKLPLDWHWVMVGTTLLLFVLVATLVDLKPEVKENFFFSPKDSEFQQTAKTTSCFQAAAR
jgi:hypothetical protein